MREISLNHVNYFSALTEILYRGATNTAEIEMRNFDLGGGFPNAVFIY